MKILDQRAAFRFQAGQLVVQEVLIQRFSIGGARRDFLGCERFG